VKIKNIKKLLRVEIANKEKIFKDLTEEQKGKIVQAF